MMERRVKGSLGDPGTARGDCFAVCDGVGARFLRLGPSHDGPRSTGGCVNVVRLLGVVAVRRQLVMVHSGPSYGRRGCLSSG